MSQKPQTVTIERDGTQVSLIIECADVYRAMATYEEFLWSLASGRLVVEVEAPQPRAHARDRA